MSDGDGGRGNTRRPDLQNKDIAWTVPNKAIWAGKVENFLRMGGKLAARAG